jgi:hypothetical protein
MNEEASYRDYDHLLLLALRRNQVTLFSLQGEDLPLDYERHVADEIAVEDFVWRSEHERIEYSLQLAIDVWASWEIHIEKSSYSRPHFGGVHVDQRWLDGSGESAPCIVMRNYTFMQPEETPAEAPVHVVWKSEQVLGPLAVFTYTDGDEGSRIWRFYRARFFPADFGRSSPT